MAALGLAVLLGYGRAAPASPEGIPNLLISEVSAHDPEFVELYNATDQVMSLEGFWFCYYPSDRDSWSDPWRAKEFPEETAIQPHEYFLLAFEEGAPESAPSADWNAYSGKLINADAGAIAILDGPPGQGAVVDAVGWGACHLSLGSPASAARPGWAMTRRPGVNESEPFLNTGSNEADFSHVPPAPSSAAAGAVLVLDDAPADERDTALPGLTVCGAGPGTCSLSIRVESDIGLPGIPQPPSVTLGPGECSRIVIHLATYEFNVLDLETTGLDARNGSIIEVGWVFSRCGEAVRTYSSLVSYEGVLDPYVTQLTGITSEMLKTAPGPGEVLPLLLDELGGKPVLCYSTFDKRFLESSIASLGLAIPEIEWIDVLPWARGAFPDLPDHRLETVTDALGLEGRHHRALPDALLAGRVFWEALQRLGSSLLITVKPEGAAFPVAAVALPVDSSLIRCDQ